MVWRRSGPLRSKWDIVKGRSPKDRSVISIHDPLSLWGIQSKSTAFYKIWDASYAPTMQQLIGFWFILNYDFNLINAISTDGTQFASADDSPAGTPQTFSLRSRDKRHHVACRLASAMLRCEKWSQKSNPYHSVYWRYDWLPYEPKYTGVDVEVAVEVRGYCFWKIFSKSRNRIAVIFCDGWKGRRKFGEVSPHAYSSLFTSSVLIHQHSKLKNCWYQEDMVPPFTTTA